MSDEVSIEVTGETIGEAKWKAVRELERQAPGLDKASVRFQVVSEGERGLLGVGYAPARVVATAAAGPIAETSREGESLLAAHMRGVVERVAGAIGVGARVDSDETDDGVFVTCSGGDLGLLIGRHGQTIDSLQYIANAIMWRSGGSKPVTVDAAGYRERRRATLEAVALGAAEQASRGERVELEPMSSAERRIVHERLKDVEGVSTSSIGAEPNRCVVVEQGDADA